MKGRRRGRPGAPPGPGRRCAPARPAGPGLPPPGLLRQREREGAAARRTREATSRPHPRAYPPTPSAAPLRALPRGLGAGSASPAAGLGGGAAASPNGERESYFSLGGVEARGRRKVQILLRP